MSVRVILLEPERSGNIGAIARSMKNFNLNDLWIVNPKTPIDGQARAYAMGGLHILEAARIVRSLEDALNDANVVVGTSSVAARSRSNLSRAAITPKQLARRVAAAKGTTAILLGRESSGLSNKEVEACDLMVTIPASHDYNVLNVASAASIVFYELFQKSTANSRELASATSKRRLLAQFEQIVEKSRIQSHRSRLAKRAFRNVISRSYLSKREASLLIGVLRKTASRLV